MTSQLEISILKGLLYEEDYTRKVLPYIKKSYFETSAGRIIFSLFEKHFNKYNTTSTLETLTVDIENLTGISEHDHKAVCSLAESLEERGERDSIEWLIDRTEEWCKERAVYLALLESITIHDGKDKQRGRDAIPGLLSEALAVGFDDRVGHDYLGDYSKRYEFYHQKEDKTSFGISYLDKITKGGVPKKTLNIFMASTGVGKSLAMCSFASNMLMNGKNILYVTMEMSEERIAERIDANLLNHNIQDIVDIPKPMFESKIQTIQRKTQGKLFVKEYPTASAHAGHIEALMKELQIKKSFTPDVLFVDYLNICCSLRYRIGSNVNSYTMVKAIAEELRGLAVKYNIPVISATQTNRSGFANSDVDLSNTSESFGLPATADLMLALISTEDMDSMNQILVKQLKNRYSDPTTHRKFILGIDRAKMKLYDVEESAQADIMTNTEELTEKFSTNKFVDFEF